MRHGDKINNLGRKANHRKAMLSNMASSLITSDRKRIITTLAKAKALRKYIEPLITRARVNTTQSRRMVFSYLQNKSAVTELFGDVAAKVGSRPGGYTRVLKLGPRQGDNAEMAMIELVDFNTMLTQAPEKKKATRRRKPGAKKKSGAKGGTVEETAPATEGEEEAEVKPAKKSSKKSTASKTSANKPASKKKGKED